jgi:hypothetical protein
MKSEEYMENALGHLVPIANVKEIDQLRHTLVLSIVHDAEEVADAAAKFKATAYSEILAFRDISAERFGAALGGTKGNISLTSYDGRYRVLLARQDHNVFNEALDIARALIREVIEELTEGINPELRLIIDSAFATNKAGQVSMSRVLGLRQLQISHPKWKQAMEAISESMQIAATKTYIRIYKRGGDGEYQLMALDGSAALPADEVTP